MEVAHRITVNLKDLSDSQIQRIATLAAYHINLVIENQNLTKEEYSRILRLWGKNPKRDVWFEDKQHHEIILVTNKVLPGETTRQGLFARGELEWHQNGALAVDPEDCVTLYCKEPAKDGCDTKFVNGVLAYETLPNDVKKQLENTMLILSSDARQFHKLNLEHFAKTKHKPKSLWGKGGPYKFQEGEVEQAEAAELFKFLHTGTRTKDSSIKKELIEYANNFTDPDGRWNCVYKKLVHAHRLTGIKGLYFPFANVIGFHDIPEDEWKDLHEFITSHYLSNVYSHYWKEGDIVLFDNTQGLHKRDPIPVNEDGSPQSRELWRGAFWYNGVS